jgi:hypothetical protein
MQFDGPQQGAGTDPMANLASSLENAGVSTAQANQVVTDLQNLKNAETTTDPTLQAKIAADQAAIAKDGGPTLPPGKSGAVMIL